MRANSSKLLKCATIWWFSQYGKDRVVFIQRHMQTSRGNTTSPIHIRCPCLAACNIAWEDHPPITQTCRYKVYMNYKYRAQHKEMAHCVMMNNERIGMAG